MTQSSPDHTAGPARLGRRPSTTCAEISHIALRLFHERGFEATTIDDIAAAAGISRRTYFRYFESKNDVAWGEFDRELDTLATRLRALPESMPLMETLRTGIIEFNRIPETELGWHRERMRLLLRVPALQAHSMLRYAAWRQVIAEFAAERLGLRQAEHAPQAIAWALLGLAISAYEQWLDHDDTDLTQLLDDCLSMVDADVGVDARSPADTLR